MRWQTGRRSGNVEDRRGMGIGRGDETRGRSRGWAREAKTEQRVDDQVGVGEIAKRFLAGFRRRVDR